MAVARINRLTLLSSLALGAWFGCANGRTLARPNSAALVARDLTPSSNLPSPWSYLGCYSDDPGARSLSDGGYNSGNQMTGQACVSYCSSRGYPYAGTEYANECYCGGRLRTSATKNADSDCSMACSGDAAQACGGPGRLTLYTNGESESAEPIVNPGPPGWESLGCYSDSGERALSNGVGVQGDMTVAKCTAACKAQDFKYAGLEYSYECYCGNEIRNGHGPQDQGCTMTCQGNNTEFCGGPNRLNMYSLPDAAASTSNVQPPDPTTPVVDQPNTNAPVPDQTTPTTVEIASTPTGRVSTVSPTASGSPGLPSGWSYGGCFVDGQFGRILENGRPDSSTLTIQSCINACAAAGYSVAGMEFARQCFCDNYVRNGAPLAAQDSQCGMACSGDANQKCGGPDRMSVYGKGPVRVLQKPAPKTENLPGDFKYVGCLTDNLGGRSLPYQAIYKTTNNATTCLSKCQEFGFHAGGMEYGEECFCGDPANVPAAARLAPESDCNRACSGDPEALCGGNDRLTYYEWDGEPLQQWDFPTGPAAGQYQYLIGGVIVPLITTVGINGKITFQEKFGTGQDNGTGAYEFDPFYDGDNDLAWREMYGIQTDIFCAAGLVLPDKAGRQVTFGGWSGTSTMGIRLYTPDGEAGVNGTNDWEENRDELQLQDGRWYPSAMMLANGSILVIGGEEGSNGPPVPNLEIVPKVGGLLEMDWLRRTDPFNLYPFLAVLPGGGIFVAYFNEARILDENTFATTKILPNIPGAVNNILGGRTYPLEGSGMILPQYAPYTDPLGYLICGGSTTGPGPSDALDTCVSIYPEAEEPSWVIERMPSKRVLACMTALPDGTYLILNGGQKGLAGFGLAKVPNLNAVLYDPRKPITRRMSVMANTTIARMYHSEALLLPDGRVLVSGSNPEDPEFPEERRIEAFLPPYLLSGLPRPDYTIENKDWAYGEQVAITVTSGSTSDLKVSLMGAESSTHGATFGQRTLFPAVSCSGNTCTITAPPNSHVCPPGWFQLFVLDGPTPSHSQFVRIGGDPAGLGNWPQVDGFNPPGV